MNSRGQLAYNAEETCRLLFMIVLDAAQGSLGNGRQPDICQDRESRILHCGSAAAFELVIFLLDLVLLIL